jgi:hypothetical protein
VYYSSKREQLSVVDPQNREHGFGRNGRGRENKHGTPSTAFDDPVRICFSITSAAESFQVFYAVIAASICSTKPNKHYFCFLIYPAHQLILLGALCCIILADANGIGPEHPAFGFATRAMQGFT